MKRILILIFGVTLFAPAGEFAGQDREVLWRQITGTVVDEQEKPVADAKVCAWGTLGTSGRVPCGQSNEKGEFSIAVQHPDAYTIYAEHFERGYPANWSFYGKRGQDNPKVTVDETASPAAVKVRLGPKAGRLVLRILDGTSANPIVSGVIELCRLGEPESRWQIGTSWPLGRYEFLTPEVAFTMKFKTWHGPVPEYHGGVASGPSGDWVSRFAFDEVGRPLEVLQVDLGQRKELTVRLK